MVHLRKKNLKKSKLWLIITYCTSPMLYTYEALSMHESSNPDSSELLGELSDKS